MKHAFYPLLGLALFLASCDTERSTSVLRNTTLEGSIDYGKAKESGNSAITYDSKTGANVVVTTEIDFEGENINKYRQDDALRDDDPKPAGGDADGRLGLRYGLGYVGKGAKFSGGNGLPINLNYLEVPIDVLYHYPAGPGELRGGLGPYFAYGIGGKSGDISSFGQNNGGFKHFDAGLNFRAGYKLPNGISLDLGYDLGLTNVEYTSEDVSGHTRTFSINVGYQIGKLFVKK